MHSNPAMFLFYGMLASSVAFAADPILPRAPDRPGDFGTGGASPGGRFGASRPPVLDPYRGLQANSPISDHTSMLGFISKYSKDIAETHGSEHPELIPLLEEIQAGVEFLQGEWVKWEQKSRDRPGGVYPFGPVELDPYYRSLKGHAIELRTARETDGPELIEKVRSIARDIRNKVKNCRNSADGLGKQIVVTAKTIQGTNQVPGFEILYAPFALLGHKGEHKRFPDLSSPATHQNLPPGFYAVWLRRDKTTNAHIALDIVTDSTGRFTFEIPVSDDFFTARR